MSETMVLLVRYKSWYISLPSFAKQQREMTKFCVNHDGVINFYFKFTALLQILATAWSAQLVERQSVLREVLAPDQTNSKVLK